MKRSWWRCPTSYMCMSLSTKRSTFMMYTRCSLITRSSWCIFLIRCLRAGRSSGNTSLRCWILWNLTSYKQSSRMLKRSEMSPKMKNRSKRQYKSLKHGWKNSKRFRSSQVSRFIYLILYRGTWKDDISSKAEGKVLSRTEEAQGCAIAWVPSGEQHASGLRGE